MSTQTEVRPGLKVGWPGMGPRIRTLRRSAEYTQEKLAEVLEVSWITVHRWEHDLRPIRYDTLFRLLEACHTDVADFMPWTDYD